MATMTAAPVMRVVAMKMATILECFNRNPPKQIKMLEETK